MKAQGDIDRVRADTPHGELVLQLRRTGHPSAALILAGTFLMDSDVSVSEEALARRALAAHAAQATCGQRLRVLVAGLGLGITLRELLASERIAEVVVVEILAPLVEWNRTHLAALNGQALADPRVTCVVEDVCRILTPPPSPAVPRYDLLLFDTDNGPSWLSIPANAWLYEREGLHCVEQWLAPGGVAAFWATERSAAFAEELTRCALAWREEIIAWEDPGSGRRLEYALYLVTK
jgi:spermidine synthase